MPLKIAILSKSYFPITGGPSTFSYNLYKGFKKMGHKVTIITPTLGLVEKGDDIIRLPSSNKLQYKIKYLLKNFNLYGFFNAYVYNEFYFKLSEYIKNKDIDLIISRNIWSNLVEKKSLDKPILVQTHGTLPNKKQNFFHRKLVNFYLSQVNYNISNSIILKNLLYEYEGIKIDKVIYNGVDNTFFYPNKIFHKGFIIGTTIKFSYRDKINGLYILIKSFKEICKQNGEVFLKIAGDGPLKNEVNTFISSLDSEVKNKIIMVGEVPYNDMPKFYNSLDLYVHISFQDALPNAILEAMSCEVPVCANTIGDVKFVLDNEAGWIVKPEIKKLTSQLASLISMDNNILKEKGKKARIKIIDKFSLEKTVRSYLKLINANHCVGK